ncbi:MAG: response regulator [Anaerolineaceae bacterium]|nr:response regulator [Anaerolineaceae bacterium]
MLEEGLTPPAASLEPAGNSSGPLQQVGIDRDVSSKATILVVDDRPTNRQFLMTLLGYGGYSLRQASNGVEALEICRTKAPDLVITDILMPAMDGFEFVHQLRSDPSLPQIPVVFYTATYREPEARVLARECGAQDVIIKPTDPQIILDKVSHWLGRQQKAALPQSPPRQPFQSDGDFRRHLNVQVDELHKVAGEIGALLNEKHYDHAWKDRLQQTVYALVSGLDSVRVTGRRLNALTELGFKLVAERDLKKMLDLFCHEARSLLGAKTAVVCFLAEDEFTLKHTYLTQTGATPVEATGQWPAENGLLGQVVARRIAVRGSAANGELPTSGLPESLLIEKSFLGVPILTTSQLDGVVLFLDRQGLDEFSLQDEQLAVSLAVQFALVYENQHLYDQVQHHATKLRVEVNERQQAQIELVNRGRQQATVVQLGQRALMGIDLKTLMDEAVKMLAETLDAEYAMVIELLPDTNVLLLRAGMGWEAELIDHATVESGRSSQSGFTLESPGPIIIEDFHKETRFKPSSLLTDHAIRSGMSAIIPGTKRVFGVLCVHSRKPRRYTPDDAHFLLSIANVLAEGIERKQAESALRESQGRLLLAAEAAGIGFWRWNFNTRELAWDTQSRTIFAFVEDAPISYDQLIDAVLPEQRPQVIRATQALLEGKQALDMEFQIVRPDGSQRWVYMRGQSYFEANQPLRALGTVLDVTRRKNAEEADRQNLARIEVQHRLLEQREQERMQIARDLHDGPVQELIGITFGLEYILFDLNGHPTNEALREVQRTIQTQIDALRNFCSDLRPSTITKFGLTPAIHAHLDNFKQKHPEIAFQVELEPEEAPIPEATRLALYRIYQETLNNIARHSNASQVTLRISYPDHDIQMEIRDNGVGFDLPDDWIELARLGHLGLVGMRERAEAVGGRIEMWSARGEGTHLSVWVPLDYELHPAP